MNKGKKEYEKIFGPELNSKLQNLKYFHMQKDKDEEFRLMLIRKSKERKERKLQKSCSPNDDDEVSFFKYLCFYGKIY